MEIDVIMTKFAEDGYVTIGRGPKHPILPDATLDQRITTFFARYRFLSEDEGYVSFMERYAGACMIRPHFEFSLDILGFTRASSHMLELPGAIIDDNGFMLFASTNWAVLPLSNQHFVEVDFAFDATGNRRRGIYITSGTNVNYRWYCRTFLQWFEDVLEKKRGVM